MVEWVLYWLCIWRCGHLSLLSRLHNYYQSKLSFRSFLYCSELLWKISRHNHRLHWVLYWLCIWRCGCLSLLSRLHHYYQSKLSFMSFLYFSELLWKRSRDKQWLHWVIYWLCIWWCGHLSLLSRFQHNWQQSDKLSFKWPMGSGTFLPE